MLLQHSIWSGCQGCKLITPVTPTRADQFGEAYRGLNGSPYLKEQQHAVLEDYGLEFLSPWVLRQSAIGLGIAVEMSRN